MNDTVLKLASYTSEHNGMIVDLSLWDEDMDGSPTVIISCGEVVVSLSIDALRGFLPSIFSLLYAIDHCEMVRVEKPNR